MPHAISFDITVSRPGFAVERIVDLSDQVAAHAKAREIAEAAGTVYTLVTIDARDLRYDDHARPWAVRHLRREANRTISDTGWRGWARRSNTAQAVSSLDLAAFLAG